MTVFPASASQALGSEIGTSIPTVFRGVRMEAGKGVTGPFEKESDVMTQVPFLERGARTQAQGRLPGNLRPLEDAGVVNSHSSCSFLHLSLLLALSGLLQGSWLTSKPLHKAVSSTSQNSTSHILFSARVRFSKTLVRSPSVTGSLWQSSMCLSENSVRFEKPIQAFFFFF